MCREKDLTEAFRRMEHYMEDTLHIKPSFYLADTRMVEILTENGQLADYTVEGDRDCYDYVYDDNLISYIQKVDDDIFSLPDWYGRNVDKEWEKNREKHNRRICFELSRYLVESLNELFKNDENYNSCILWNKNLTHYFVGLTSNEYSLAIDLDDFFRIKDLTRVKTGLTLEGITILEDDKDKFKNVLDKACAV